jgi:disease resistance protein RPS2
MTSYCCFWKPRQPSNMPVLQINHRELISFQGMLGLLGRPGVGVVVIQGIGGSGKTWAAKALYRAAKTSNLFDEYIWVSLSINCSMRKCFNKIAASLSCKTRDSLSVESTRTIIKEYLTPRKFLLVLDNAYFTEESILEYLGVPDPRQQRLGSKIFVTTRTVRARSVMLPNIEIMPQPLTYEESYDLLREKIGKDISFAHDLISYCYGIPLIIILLAGALYDAPTEETFSELVANAHAALST